MNLAAHISADLASREVRIGKLLVQLHPAPAMPNTFHLQSSAGYAVRALSFEERGLILARSKASEVAAEIAGAALMTPNDAPDSWITAVSLALAGGGEVAPSFEECSSRAVRENGFNWEQVGQTAAIAIDQLSRSAESQSTEDGWKRIVFPEPEPDIEALIGAMAENLLQRSVSMTAVKQPVIEEAAEPAQRRTFSFRLLNDRVNTSTPGTSTIAAKQRVDEQESSSAAVVSSPSESAPVRPQPGAKATASRTASHRAVVRSVVPLAASPANPVLPKAPIRASVNPTAITQPAVPIIAPPANPIIPFKPTSAASDGPRVTPISPSFVPISPAHPVASASEPVTWPRKRGEPSPVESIPTSDWMAELAAMLEAECDLRGIDA